jgi:hypothetical protein
LSVISDTRGEGRRSARRRSLSRLMAAASAESRPKAMTPKRWPGHQTGSGSSSAKKLVFVDDDVDDLESFGALVVYTLASGHKRTIVPEVGIRLIIPTDHPMGAPSSSTEAAGSMPCRRTHRVCGC